MAKKPEDQNAEDLNAEPEGIESPDGADTAAEGEGEGTEDVSAEGGTHVVVEVPEDLTDADLDLGALEASLLDAFREANDAEVPDVDLLTALADSIDRVRGEGVRREAEAEAAEAKRAELAAQVLGSDDPEDDDEDEGDDDAAGDDDGGEGETAEGKVPDGEPAMASARRFKVPSKRLPNRATNADAATNAPTGAFSLVASGADREVEKGQALSGLGELAKLTMRRHQRTAGMLPGEYVSVGQFVRNTAAEMTFTGHADHDAQVMEDLRRGQTTESLVASGCGPCETVYDICDISEVDCLIDIPEREAMRGSVCFPTPGCDLKDLIEALADNVACPGDTKAEIEASCPEWGDPVEVCARYLIVKFDNFTARSSPEVYEHCIEKMLQAHAVNVHLDTLLTMVTDPTTVVQDLSAMGAAGMGSTLSAILYAIETTKSEFCMGEMAGVEVILPKHLKAQAKADLAQREGCCEVSDGQLEDFLMMAGARVQWVNFWQMLDPAGTAWPGTASALVYPSGTFTKLTQGTLDLGFEIRSPESNADNCYYSFIEDFYQTALVCHHAKLVTLPTCATGARALGVEVPCGPPGPDPTARMGAAGKEKAAKVDAATAKKADS